MSKLPQGFCFPDDLREKLQDPSLPLNDWKEKVLEEDITLKVKPSTGKRSKGFAISYSDKNGIGREVLRSKADFAQLEKYLVERFPGAVVPPFPKGNPSLYGVFLQTVALNPYYRSDASFRAFIDGGTEKYRKKKLKDETKKKSKGREGMLRWLQALNEYPDQTKLLKNTTKLNSVKAEFEQLYKNLGALSKTMSSYVQKLSELARASKMMEQSMTALLAGEKNYTTIKGASLGAYGELGDILHQTVNYSMKQAGVSAKEYGATMFGRRVADPLLYEVLTVANWKKSISAVIKKQEAFLKAQKGLESHQGASEDEKDNMKLEKYEETEKVTYIEFFKQVQGTMGVELEEYRKKRTEKMKQMYDNISQFHLLGATKTTEVWNPKGTKEVEWSVIDDDFEEDFLDERRSSQRLSMSSALFRSSSVRHTITADKTVTLKVVKPFVSKKAKFLSLEEGEILTAQRHSEDMWLAINKKGKQGFVHSDYVVVGNQSVEQELAETPRKKPSMPPGLVLAPPGMGGKDDDDDSDSDFDFDGDSHVSKGSGVRKKGVIPRIRSRPGPPGHTGSNQRLAERGQKEADQSQGRQPQTRQNSFPRANRPRGMNRGTPANSLRPPGAPPVNPLVAAFKQNPNLKDGLKTVGSTESKSQQQPPRTAGAGAQSPTLMGELTQTLQNRRESVKKEE